MSTVPRTCLTRIEARKLEDMVEQHRKEFEEGKWTYRSFADHATQQMKRPVTESNVKGACHVMEVHIRANAKKNGTEEDRRLDDLRRATSDLAHQMLLLMNAVELEPVQEFWTAKEWLDGVRDKDDHDI